MKKIFNILLLALGVIAFSACDDDTENPYDVESSVTVLTSNVIFDAKASTGSITYVADGSVTVATGSSWCDATLSGDSILVNVTQNTTINGRSTVVTLRCNGDSVQVPVTQLGVVVQLGQTTFYAESDEEQTLAYSIESNVDLSIISTPDWATAELEGDSIFVNLSENTTGHIRTGYIVYQSEEYSDSVRVLQADYDNDIAGSYKLYYTNTSGRERSTNATLSSTQITLTSYRLSIPITYDPSTATFSIQCGQYLGVYSGSYIYIAFNCNNSYWTGYYTTSYVSGDLVYDPEVGDMVEFEGDLGSDDYPVTGFLFEKFTSNVLSSTYDDGVLLQLDSPYLLREI